MRVSSFSGKAQVFKDGKWSEWMPADEAKRIETEMFYGNRGSKGIYLLSTAKELGMTRKGTVNAPTSYQEKH